MLGFFFSVKRCKKSPLKKYVKQLAANFTPSGPEMFVYYTFLNDVLGLLNKSAKLEQKMLNHGSLNNQTRLQAVTLLLVAIMLFHLPPMFLKKRRHCVVEVYFRRTKGRKV